MSYPLSIEIIVFCSKFALIHLWPYPRTSFRGNWFRSLGARFVTNLLDLSGYISIWSVTLFGWPTAAGLGCKSLSIFQCRDIMAEGDRTLFNETPDELYTWSGKLKRCDLLCLVPLLPLSNGHQRSVILFMPKYQVLIKKALEILKRRIWWRGLRGVRIKFGRLLN